MITVAKIFVVIGAVLGVQGLLMGALLVLAWWHDRRAARQPLFTPHSRALPRHFARHRCKNFPASAGAPASTVAGYCQPGVCPGQSPGKGT